MGIILVRFREDHKKDPAYKQAKREGYRARSAYKLLDIERKFNLFKRAFYILDIGSTPGSWLQVAKEMAEKNIKKYQDEYYHRDHYKIMGVDVKSVAAIEGVNIVKMDATSQEFLEEVRKFFQEKVDLVISDASINKSGDKFSDQLRQINLCYKILDIAKDLLKPNGNFVLKIFQGADYNEFYRHLKNAFFSIKTLKPQTSNQKSNEIYLIGLSKKED